MKRYLVNLKIKRHNYETTISARFHGELDFVCNENGIIRDWKINFSEIWIDLYTTNSWFTKPNFIFRKREQLFKELQLEQLRRPHRDANKLLKLNDEQIKIVNNFFNDRMKFNSTLKSIVGILKGNNPGGEAKNPQAAELIVDTNEENIKNFVILLDDLTYPKKEHFAEYSINAESLTLNDFMNLNKSLKDAFDYMQKPKNEEGFAIYLQEIKDYYKKYNDWWKEGNQIAEQARKKYAKNVTSSLKTIKLPFDFKDAKEFQKCHIYEYWVLRDKLIEALENDDKNKITKYANMIADAENFIPLPEEVHRQFDRHVFTYNLDGSVYPINEEGYNYINSMMDERFKNIEDSFMTKKRKFYLEERNKNIDFWE